MFFVSVLIIILATKLAGDLCVRIGQPSVLGKLLVGIIIGPAMLGLVEQSNLITELSQIGVLLLMFIAGLETNIQDLKANSRSATAVALGGIIAPFVGSYFFGMAIGMTLAQSIFLGLLLSATSVSISVQALKDLNLLKSRESTTILGAAIVDDIVVVILLAVALSFAGGADVNIGLVLGKKVLFFIIIGLLMWKGTHWIMLWLSKLRISQPVISAGLVLCFLFAYIAEFLGVAGIIGSFAAGLALSNTKYKHEVEQKVEPIAYTIFVPIFFVSIGFNVTFDGISNQIGFIVILTLIAIATKWIGSGLGAKLTGFSTRSSIGIGAGMVSRGEVALIIAAIGLEAHLLSPDYFTAAIIVVLLTTLITPILLKISFANK